PTARGASAIWSRPPPCRWSRAKADDTRCASARLKSRPCGPGLEPPVGGSGRSPIFLIPLSHSSFSPSPPNSAGSEPEKEKEKEKRERSPARLRDLRVTLPPFRNV